VLFLNSFAVSVKIDALFNVEEKSVLPKQTKKVEEKSSISFDKFLEKEMKINTKKEEEHKKDIKKTHKVNPENSEKKEISNSQVNQVKEKISENVKLDSSEKKNTNTDKDNSTIHKFFNKTTILDLQHQIELVFELAKLKPAKEDFDLLKKINPEEIKNLVQRLKSSSEPKTLLKEFLKSIKLSEHKKDSSPKTSDAFFTVTVGNEEKIAVNEKRINITVDKRSHLSKEQKVSHEHIKSEQIKIAENQKNEPLILKKNLDSFITKETPQSKITNNKIIKEEHLPDIIKTNRIFDEIVKQAKLMLQDKKSIMELELKPPHLGRVTLKIEVSDKKISANFVAFNETTRDFLKQNMSDLYQAFQNSGFNTGSLDVTIENHADNKQNEYESVERIEEKNKEVLLEPLFVFEAFEERSSIDMLA